MATTAPNSMPLGTPAPAFELPDVVSSNTVSLADFSKDDAVLVMFICAHCPYVVHVRGELVRLADEYQPRNVGFIAISSNDAIKYPDDSPEFLRRMAVDNGFPFPMLHDESQDVARAYTAACTPDFFLFNGDHRLAYRGRLDASTPGNGQPVTGSDLRSAIDAVLSNQPVPPPHHPSLGCSIKWK